MNWILSENSGYEVFDRNMLQTVSVELRFQPILLLRTRDAIAGFQNSVRGILPGYLEEEGTVVNINTNGVSETKQSRHKFFDRANSYALYVTTDSLLLEASDHKDREHTLDILDLGLKALSDTCGDVGLTRLGVRYINIISREEIAHDLRRDVQWNDLLHAEFLSMPNGIVDLDDTIFSNEIDSSLDLGRMRLRYGLHIPQNGIQGQRAFHFDVDRYAEGEFELESACDLARNFTQDIYGTFSSARGEALREWMSNEAKA